MKITVGVIFALMLIPISAFGQSEPIQNETEIINLPDIGIFEGHTTIQNEDGSYTTSTHYSYLEDYNGLWVPYRIIEESDFIQVEVNGGKIVFDKINGATTIFKGDTSVINSDSYRVRMADINSDVWTLLDVNNNSVSTTIIEEGDKVIITFTRENNEGKFEIEYEVRGNLKATAKFTNYIYDNTKFAFTQTLNLNDNLIKLNDQTINLNDYIGQTFPREVLEQNLDLIIEVGNLYYNSGLGFENLWSVGIFEDNKIALDYANVEQTITAIGETVELDPSVTLSNDFAKSGQINSSAGNLGTSSSAQCTATSKTNGIGTSQAFIGIGYAYCNRAIVDFDITSIPDSATITDVDLESTKFYRYYHGSIGCEFRSIASNGISSSTSATTLWNEISTGTVYAQDTTTPCEVQTGAGYGNRWAYNVMWDLGTNADSDLQAELAVDNNWDIGIKGYLNGDGSGSVSYPSVVHANGFYENNYPMKIHVTYTVPNPPTAPQTLTTTQSTANQIILNYLAPSSNGGASITNYKIYLDGSLIDTIGNILTYTDNISGSEIGSGLTYSVKAVNPAGDSVASNNSFITSWDVPDAPTGFQAVTGSPITMSWVTPNSDDTILNFKIYRDNSLIDTIGAVNSYTDNTTVSGNSYVYEVSAFSAVGEGLKSSSSTALHGLPWNPPGSVNAIITDVNNFPYVIDVSWSGSTQGSGTGVLTGYELWRTNGANTVLVATLGTVIIYSDTVTLANTNFEYFVKSTSTHGTSGSSPNSNTVTTPTIPSAITDLSGSVMSDTKINLSWSIPNNGGSNIIDYDVLRNGVTIATVTTNSYQSTGLTPNTQYTFEVFSRNNIGFSLISNQAIETTYLSVSGSITVTSNTQGATTELTFAPSGVTGTPTPNFNLFALKEGVTILANGITSPYYLAHDDFNSHNYTLTSTDNSHWNNPTITGATTIQSDYSPSWNTQNVSYNYTRASGVLDLTVNKQNAQNTWDAVCTYKTTSEVMKDQPGINSTHAGVWYISESKNISDIDTVYVNCKDNGDTLFSFTSFGPNRLGGGIAQLDDFFGGMTGTPVALIFVLLVAGLFTGRTAPTGILVMLALIGVLGFIGLLTLDEAVWGFLLLAGVLGIFLGKRFL